MNSRELVKKLLKNKSLNFRQIQRLSKLNKEELKELIKDINIDKFK